MVSVLEVIHLDYKVLEGLLDTLVLLGRALEVLHAELRGDFFGLLVGDLALLDEVHFVADHNFADFVVSVLLNRLHPHEHVLERLLIGDVKGDQHTLSLSVKSVRKRMEALLASRVPKLHIELLVATRRLELLCHVVEA